MKKVRQESVIFTHQRHLATRSTMLVGTIWASYAFVIFGLLPIITVGTTLMSRASEAPRSRITKISAKSCSSVA